VKVKSAISAAALFVSSVFVATTPAWAEVYFIQCDAQTCYEVVCGEYPNVNIPGQWGAGCTVLASWPRPREMGGD